MASSSTAVKKRSDEQDSQDNADRELHPIDDCMEYLAEYTRERPEVVALTCLGIGFILGWKLKPW